MSLKLLKSKRALAVVGAITVLALAGAAVAYWTSSGSGSGTGQVASSNGTLVLTGTVSHELYPGGSSPVSFTAEDTGTSSLQVGTIQAVVSVDAAHAEAGCKASDFSIANTVENQTVAAGTTASLTNNGTVTMTDSSENQDACKGATLTLSLTS